MESRRESSAVGQESAMFALFLFFCSCVWWFYVRWLASRCTLISGQKSDAEQIHDRSHVDVLYFIIKKRQTKSDLTSNCLLYFPQYKSLLLASRQVMLSLRSKVVEGSAVPENIHDYFPSDWHTDVEWDMLCPHIASCLPWKVSLSTPGGGARLYLYTIRKKGFSSVS